MTEDQLTRIFGDLTVVQVVLWLIAAAALIALIVKAWPVLTGFVKTIDLVGGLPARLTSMDERVERVRAQVENSHDTNLREDIDEQRAESQRMHAELLEQLRGVRKDIGRLDQRDIDRGHADDALRRELADQGTRIERLENGRLR